MAPAEINKAVAAKDLEEMQVLRELFLNLRRKIMPAPRKREFAGEWAEIVIGIGPDHTAYVTMTKEALTELLKLTKTP